MPTLVLDTFTGAAGILADHVGETGATWEYEPLIDGWTNSDPFYEPFMLYLDGAGGLLSRGMGGYVPSGSRGMTDALFAIEVEMELLANGRFDPAFGFLWGLDGDLLETGYVVDVWFDDAAQMLVQLRSPTLSFVGANTGWFAFVPGTHTFRVEVTPTTKRVLLNGVELFEVTDSALTEGFAWLGGGRGTDLETPSNRILSYSIISDVAAEDPFWTSFTSATEVFR